MSGNIGIGEAILIGLLMILVGYFVAFLITLVKNGYKGNRFFAAVFGFFAMIYAAIRISIKHARSKYKKSSMLFKPMLYSKHVLYEIRERFVYYPDAYFSILNNEVFSDNKKYLHAIKKAVTNQIRKAA